MYRMLVWVRVQDHSNTVYAPGNTSTDIFFLAASHWNCGRMMFCFDLHPAENLISSDLSVCHPDCLGSPFFSSFIPTVLQQSIIELEMVGRTVILKRTLTLKHVYIRFVLFSRLSFVKTCCKMFLLPVDSPLVPLFFVILVNLGSRQYYRCSTNNV